MPSLNKAAARRRRSSRSNSAGGMRTLASASPGKVNTRSFMLESYVSHPTAASPDFDPTQGSITSFPHTLHSTPDHIDPALED